MKLFYKFKSESSDESIDFDGTEISVRICLERKLSQLHLMFVELKLVLPGLLQYSTVQYDFGGMPKQKSEQTCGDIRAHHSSVFFW